MVRKDAWNDFNVFEFTKARFMALDVVYPGEGSMCFNKLDLREFSDRKFRPLPFGYRRKKISKSKVLSITVLQL